MHEFPIPVVGIGPGSQPEEDAASYLPLPHGMDTYSPPIQVLESDPATLAAACAVLQRLRDAMLAAQANSDTPPRLDLRGLSPEVRELVNQSLGQGEVSVRVAGGQPLHIQETVFTGVWRVQSETQDDVVAAGMPPEVLRAATAGASDQPQPASDAGLMNAPALLTELVDKSRACRPGQPAHIINLSLLPVTPRDLEYLGEALGFGDVSILSRGYGNCRITATRLNHVWWVQYFNSTDQILLNTLEVVDIPEVALAAQEDYAESVERLGEWLATMREEAHV